MSSSSLLVVPKKPSSLDLAKSSPNSNLTSFKIEHIWKIDQYKDKVKDENKPIESSMFSVAGHDIQFQLKLYPNENAFTSLFLYCIPGKTVISDVYVTNDLDLLGENENVKIHRESSTTFKDSISSIGYEKLVENSFLLNSQSKIVHANGQLHVRCMATVSYVKASKFILGQLAILESGKYSDFSIAVGTVKIPVHKAILAAHSPVFEAMFSNKDTKEAKEIKVEIPNVSVVVMEDFLEFIYTGVKPKDDLLTITLLALAEKYKVEELKLHCENCLSTELGVYNVIPYFQDADLYNADKLKENCLTFMASNFNQVVQTKDWELLCKAEGGQKVLEVSRAIAKIQVSSKK